MSWGVTFFLPSPLCPSSEGKYLGLPRGRGEAKGCFNMKPRVSNIPILKGNRRKLRNESTPQKIMLWSRLKSEQLGFKFRRQHSFGSYIADFYCRERSLVIEIDGSQHLDQEMYDEKRTKFLENLGLRVLRFGNNEINTNIDGVMTGIMELLEN